MLVAQMSDWSSVLRTHVKSQVLCCVILMCWEAETGRCWNSLTDLPRLTEEPQITETLFQKTKRMTPKE